MLILKRKIGEVIRIYDNIQVTVIGFEGQRVKIGIDAPKEVPVNREEIYQRLSRQQMEADKEKAGKE